TLTAEGSGDGFASDVSPAGDFNSDGYPDFLIGARSADVVGTNEGKAYVYYGGPGWDTIPDQVFEGSADSDLLGHSVSHADVNGDGVQDAIVGVPWSDAAGANSGRVQIYFGGSAPDALPDMILNGTDAGDEFGWDVRGAGDLNGDGIGDFIVGARKAEAGGYSRGQAYVHYGSFWGNTTPDLTFSGQADSDFLGSLVAPAGDVNADGFDDVIVAGSTSRQLVHVYFGGPNADDVPDLILEGQNPNDQFGGALDGGRDVNGDGFDDFMITADGNDDAGHYFGAAYLYFGGPGLDTIPD
ncbi:MAG: hypothetical protein GY778_31680, partial [bacterium]|nr:hypothetical protein [bacterium]